MNCWTKKMSLRNYCCCSTNLTTNCLNYWTKKMMSYSKNWRMMMNLNYSNCYCCWTKRNSNLTNCYYLNWKSCSMKRTMNWMRSLYY